MKFVRWSFRSMQLCSAGILMLASCSSDAPKPNAGSSGSSGMFSVAGAPNNGSAGSSTVAGAAGSANSTATAGAGTATAGFSNAGGAAGNSNGNGGASSGGASGTGGSSLTTGGAASGGTGTTGGACSRDFLKSTLTAYFAALAAHSASGLPLSDGLKATENGKTIMVGQDGLWKTAGAVKYSKSALDTDGCNTATEAVVPEGSSDLPVALRLKLVNRMITEIETIAVRAGDYKVSGSNYPSKPEAIITSDATVMWESPVPAAMRNTPQELNAWMSKYFKAFPAGVCNTDANCKRLENGNSPGGCNVGASCQSGDPTSNVLKSHAIFSDAETGIGAGFDYFMGNADMHLFKMYGGKVYAVHAVLGAAGSTGWDDK